MQHLNVFFLNSITVVELCNCSLTKSLSAKARYSQFITFLSLSSASSIDIMSDVIQSADESLFPRTTDNKQFFSKHWPRVPDICQAPLRNPVYSNAVVCPNVEAKRLLRPESR